MAVNLEQNWQMMAQGVASQTSARNVLSSQIYLDPSWFDGATYYFEVTAKNANATTDYYLQLYDATAAANLLGDNAGSGIKVAKNTSATTRFRSASFTPNAGKHILNLVTPATASSSDVSIESCCLVIVQVNATKTVIQLPLVNYLYHNLSTADNYSVRAQGATYADPDVPSYQHALLKDAARYAALSGATPWRFEAVLRASNAASTGYAKLYNETAAALVTGTELSVAGTGFTLTDVSFADDAANWTDGQHFHMQLHATSTYYGQVARAAVYVTLDPVSKGEVYYCVGKSRTGTAAVACNQYDRSLITKANFSSPILYAEVTGYCADNATAVAFGTASTNDSGTTESDLAAFNWNSATRAYARSAALTFAAADRYVWRTAATTASQYHAGVYAVVAFTAPASTPINLLRPHIIPSLGGQ